MTLKVLINIHQRLPVWNPLKQHSGMLEDTEWKTVTYLRGCAPTGMNLGLCIPSWQNGHRWCVDTGAGEMTQEVKGPCWQAQELEPRTHMVGTTLILTSFPLYSACHHSTYICLPFFSPSEIRVQLKQHVWTASQQTRLQLLRHKAVPYIPLTWWGFHSFPNQTKIEKSQGNASQANCDWNGIPVSARDHSSDLSQISCHFIHSKLTMGVLTKITQLLGDLTAPRNYSLWF